MRQDDSVRDSEDEPRWDLASVEHRVDSRPTELIEFLLSTVLDEDPDLEILMLKQDDWRTFAPETLGRLLRRELLRYGISQDPILVNSLDALYRACVDRLSIEERKEIFSQIVDFVDNVPLAGNALLPFIYAEAEFSIMASAALALSVVIATTDEDPFAGPEFVRALVGQTDDQKVKASLFAGLLLTGDARLYELTDRCWESLTEDGRELLTRFDTDFPSAFLVNFYLDWLESVVEIGNDDEVGLLAGTLARIGINSDKILDIERKFPASQSDGQPQIRILSEWTIRQFGQRVAPRLMDIMEFESEPKILPMVFEYWGLAIE